MLQLFKFKKSGNYFYNNVSFLQMLTDGLHITNIIRSSQLCVDQATNSSRPSPTILNSVAADFTVLIILAATLYGSAALLGRRSSSQPFQPLSTVPIGMRMDAPLSETPYLNSSIAAVSCLPVKRK